MANRNVSRGAERRPHRAPTAWSWPSTAATCCCAGLDLGGSLTYADSVIEKNDGFVAVPGDTLGKRQPNIPRWRATALASYRFDAAAGPPALGARYSGTQYRTLDNSDVNGFTYQGASTYFTADLRVRWQIDAQWSAAFGIDNLNNYSTGTSIPTRSAATAPN